jgi:cell division protease FtsH
MKQTQKSMALWAIFIVTMLLFFQMYRNERSITIPNFNYAKFVTALEAGHIQSVTFREQDILGEIKKEFASQYITPRNGQVVDSNPKFEIVGNTGTEGYNLVIKNKITPNYEKNENSLMTSIFLNGLPLIIIILMFIFLFRQIQSGGGKAMNFGKSRARLLTENKNKVTFKDVAGVDEAKQDLVEIVQFLKDPKKFTKLGGRIPKGVLLVGSPGTGKTLLARAVAGEANVPFFTISGSDFVEMFVGVGASRVRDLFEQGKKNAPCLIFIDEIDAVGRHRGAGMGGGHDEREQTLNQLLVEMDGFESNEGVILIAATNRPDVLDPALLRPGRFDRRVVVNKPDLGGREHILKVHTRKTPIASDVDITRIARGTPGFSGADLENLVNEAALQAAREDKNKLEMSDFEKAKDKILMGSERKSMIVSEEDKKITAYHEAGHTLVGRLIPGMDPIHKVSIIPRGMALGVTQTLPKEDMLNLTKSKAENMIAFLFGGRAAEEIVFKDYTTGAGNDIERATGLARSMVCEWGMSEKIGPLALEKREGPVFLGMQSTNDKNYSESKAEEVDSEVKRLVGQGHDLAVKLLTDNYAKLDMIAKALLEYETIDGEEVEMIMHGKNLDDIRSLRASTKTKLDAEQKEAGEKNKAEEELKKKTDNDGRDPVGNTGPATA